MIPVDSNVKSIFESIAPRYDLLNHLLSANLDKAWRKKTVLASSITLGERILDLCTGTGDLAALFADAAGPEGEVVGLDFCDGMLALAQKKYPAKKSRRLSFVTGDALRVSFPDESFDCVSIAFGLRNITSIATFFQETARLLKDGGRVVVLELTRPGFFLKAIYHPFLHGVLPIIGGLFSGNHKAYRYLADSIENFISPEKVEEEMQSAGFTGIRLEPLTGGIATIVTGRKNR